jgi:hypothetical protein
MKEATKSSVITLSSYVAVVVGFISAVNTGVLVSWDRITLWDYSLSQFITVILLGGGIGVIVSEIAFGTRKAKDILRDTQQFLEETIGMDEKQFGRSVKKGIKKLGVSDELAGTVTDKLLTVNAATGAVEYPSPGELQTRLRADFRAQVFAATVVASTGESSGVQSSLAIPAVPGTAATSDGLEKASDYLRTRAKATIIALVVVGILFVISLIIFKWWV